jgi:hypothetical protein
MSTINKKKEFPTSIRLLGQKFRIELVDAVDEDGSDGEMYGQMHRIRISKHLDTNRKWKVLLHESVHAILHVNGVGNKLDGDIEEVIAQSLEYGISQLLAQHGAEIVAALQEDK